MSPILKMRLLTLLCLAFLLHPSIAHLHAQQLDPRLAGTCPLTATSYGAVMSYYVGDNATPGGQNYLLKNKNCADQQLQLSDQNTLDSTTKASNATTSYSYYVGHGRLNLSAEVNVSGHKADIPVSGGTYHALGTGSGHLVIWLRWVDTLTLHSATAKPVNKDFPDIKTDQIVEITLKLLNNGKNVCTGGSSESSFYKVSVGLVGDTGSNRQPMGGQVNFDVNSGCQDQNNQGTIQVLLGLGQFRVNLAANAELSGFAKNGDGYAETADVKVQLGQYQICYQVLKGPKDLTITSASGTDYACNKK